MSGDRGARVRIRRSRAIGLVMLVGICVAACGVPADGGTRGELRGWVIDTPVPKPDLTLTDTNGEAFDLRAETEGYLTLVFFGYTYCPDVCPVHMANLGAVFGDLIPEVRDRIKVVFVSTDPERDTPERLRSWLDNFDRSFVGLRGTSRVSGRHQRRALDDSAARSRRYPWGARLGAIDRAPLRDSSVRSGRNSPGSVPFRRAAVGLGA